MEKFYLSLVLLFVSLVILSLSVLFYKHRSPFTVSNLPPGRIGYPVIGETLAYLSSGRNGHPETFMHKRMTETSSSIFKTLLFLQPTIVFCGSECNKFLFSNENKLVKSWWPETVNMVFPSSLDSNMNEEGMRMRQMLPQFIGIKTLQCYVGVMDTIAQTHFASHWDNKSQVTVLPLTKRYTFWLACRLFLSIEDPKKVEKLEKPFDMIAKGVMSMPINFPGTPFNKAIKASIFIREELLKIIKERKVELSDGKASPTQDILSHMLLAHDEDGKYLSEHSIADKILGLLVGAYDTASSTCTFIVKFLAELPQIYQQVYQEQMEIVKSKNPGEQLNMHDIEKMKYSWKVACEVMRLTPPLQGSFREATTNFVFNGFSIPKGWKLYWSAYSTHMNPKYFLDPMKFDPHRFDGSGPAPYTYVPFGGGPRMCPGKEYARMEILVFMHNLVKRFKWEMIIPNEKIVVNPLPFPAKGLPIRHYPHS